MKSFIEPQFGYYSLSQMCDGRGANNKINHLHERLLCIVYKDNNRSFNNPLKKDNSFTAHHKNIQSIDIEFFR